MSIAVTCAACGKSLNAPDSAAGKRAKCPQCSAVLLVPAAAATAQDNLLSLLEDAEKSAPPPLSAPAFGTVGQRTGPRVQLSFKSVFLLTMLIATGPAAWIAFAICKSVRGTPQQLPAAIALMVPVFILMGAVFVTAFLDLAKYPEIDRRRVFFDPEYSQRINKQFKLNTPLRGLLGGLMMAFWLPAIMGGGLMVYGTPKGPAADPNLAPAAAAQPNPGLR